MIHPFSDPFLFGSQSEPPPSPKQHFNSETTSIIDMRLDVLELFHKANKDQILIFFQNLSLHQLHDIFAHHINQTLPSQLNLHYDQLLSILPFTLTKKTLPFLPTDLWLYILQYFDQSFYLTVLTRVSKSFRRLVFLPSNWFHFDFRQFFFHFKRFNSFRHNLSRFLPFIHDLTFPLSFTKPFNSLKKILLFPKLEKLTLIDYSDKDEKEKFVNLNFLLKNFQSQENDKTQTSSLLNLTLINFNNINNLTPHLISNIFPNIHSLHFYWFSNIYSFIDDHFISAIGSYYPSLTELDLISDFPINFSDSSIESVSNQCHNLKCFKIDTIQCISDNALISLSSNCPSLEILYLHSTSSSPNQKITDNGLINIARQCPKLREIELLCVIIYHLDPNFEEFNLYSHDITDKSIEELYKNCLIEHLSLHCCQITDISLKLFIQFPFLRYLDLANIPNISNKGLGELINVFKSPRTKPFYLKLEGFMPLLSPPKIFNQIKDIKNSSFIFSDSVDPLWLSLIIDF